MEETTLLKHLFVNPPLQSSVVALSKGLSLALLYTLLYTRFLKVILKLSLELTNFSNMLMTQT